MGGGGGGRRESDRDRHRDTDRDRDRGRGRDREVEIERHRERERERERELQEHPKQHKHNVAQVPHGMSAFWTGIFQNGVTSGSNDVGGFPIFGAPASPPDSKRILPFRGRFGGGPLCQNPPHVSQEAPASASPRGRPA